MSEWKRKQTIVTAPIRVIFALKGIGEVTVKVPRDRKGEYRTQVIPKSKQYEDELRQDIAVMFLSGVSTRTLSMISHRFNRP